MRTAVSSVTRCAWGRTSSITRPLASVTRKYVSGSAFMPSAAKTPKAEVSSRGVTTEVPRPSVRSVVRGVEMPKRWALSITATVPISLSSLTVMTLLDCSRALRRLTTPSFSLS
ncbi:hypothetical protein D3C78_1706270 [compost metagenome]